MARIPYVDPEQAPPEVRAALEALPPLNVFRTLAHAETCLRPALRLGGAILGAQQLDPLLRELAILHVACRTGAEYEWIQHADIARAVGASDEQVAAVRDAELQAACFDDRARLVLRFADELLAGDAVSETTFAAMVQATSAREAVELLLAVGYYRLLAGVMRSVDIDLDEPLGADVLGSARP